MGVNDNLIEDYRNLITDSILNNQTIIEILANTESDETYDLDNPDELLWKHIIPQQYIPDVITDTGSYILYDIDETVNSSFAKNAPTYTELTLYFWIITHKNMPKYEGRLRNDILSRELKNVFGEQGGLGIGKNHLVYNRIFNTNNVNYTGRVMAFLVTDFVDKVRFKNGR